MFPIRKLPAADASAPVDTPALPPDPPPDSQETPEVDPLEALSQVGSVPALDQVTVQYMTGDLGPFSCGTCAHYLGNSCDVVSGEIDPAGLCRVWTPGYDQMEMADPAEPALDDLAAEPPPTDPPPDELPQMKG